MEAAAEKKIRDAGALEEAVSRLTPQERARVQALPELLRLLARLSPRHRREWPASAPAGECSTEDPR